MITLEHKTICKYFPLWFRNAHHPEEKKTKYKIQGRETIILYSTRAEEDEQVISIGSLLLLLPLYY